MKHIKKLIIICLSISFVLCVFNEQRIYAKPSKTGFCVTFLDVGAADAALVTCDNHYMMIDCGSDSMTDGKSKQRIDYYLQQENISYFDYIICTHADDDHYGGFVSILKNRKFGKVYCSTKGNTKSTSYTKFKNIIKKKHKRIKVPKVGTHFKLGSAKVEVLAVNTDTKTTNDASIVLMITYGNNKFLFTGDAESKTEKILLGKNIKCDVLKVAHHGSKTSSHSYFLRKAKPKYMIVSVSEKKVNNDGISDDLLDYSDMYHVPVYYTYVEGTILCKSNGKKITLKNLDGKKLN